METPNLAYIHKLSGGDKAFEGKIIAIIKEEFPVEKEIYQKSIATNKIKETAEIVHKLKHKFSILGLEKSYGLAVEYENNLKENNKALTVEFSKVLDIITVYLKKL